MNEKKIVSLFASFRATSPTANIPIEDFLFDRKNKKKVDEVRACKDEAQKRKLKANLPCITPSGIFLTRNNAGLSQYSGLVCLDIDGKENPNITDWEAVKGWLSTFTGLYYCGLSVSGNGLFCLIRIAKPGKHPQHFNALKKDFQEMGIVIDGHCGDIARLRCASFDERPIYVPMVGKYKKMAKITLKSPRGNVATTDTIKNNRTVEKTTETTATPIRSLQARSKVLWSTDSRVNALVDVITCNRIDITDLYADWYAVGRSLAAEYGESGRQMFHAISRQSGKYQPDECDLQFTACLKTCSRTTIATLFAIAKKFSVTLIN
jgi:hypothetical protein